MINAIAGLIVNLYMIPCISDFALLYLYGDDLAKHNVLKKYIRDSLMPIINIYVLIRIFIVFAQVIIEHIKKR